MFPSLVPPAADKEVSQTEWDGPVIEATKIHLLDLAPDDVARARLLAVSAPESGAWLQALPVSSLGLRMDDVSVRVSVSLRLGLPVCAPHDCRNCGAPVTRLGLHGLSCKKGDMRFHRHVAINDLLRRAFSSAGIPTCLEPSSVSRTDGKRPDGMTLVPWERGKSLLWDATVPDSMAPSYRSTAVSGTGGLVAGLAETKKWAKYSHLTDSYVFTPVAIESFGAFGPKSKAFLNCLGRTIKLYSGDNQAKSYLFQRISVAIQRGNTALIMDTVPNSISGFDL